MGNPAIDGRGLDADQILVAQMAPGCGRVELAGRDGEGPHPLHRDPIRLDGIGRERPTARELGHLTDALLHQRDVGRNRYGQLPVSEGADYLVSQGAIGHFEAGRPGPREPQAELRQRFEGDPPVGHLLSELHVDQIGLEAEPDRAPRAIGCLVPLSHPHGHLQQPALPGVRRAPG